MPRLLLYFFYAIIKNESVFFTDWLYGKWI